MLNGREYVLNGVGILPVESTSTIHDIDITTCYP